MVLGSALKEGERVRQAVTEAASGWRRVAIIGLGLIGGSLAHALKRLLPGLHVAGLDRSPEPPQSPGPALPLDAYRVVGEPGALAAALTGADLVVLAAPVRAIETMLPEVLSAAPATAIVTDCGSTKRAILRAAAGHARAASFVCGHPMAGPLAGSPHPTADLFAGRPWVLCPGSSSDALGDRAQRLASLLRAIGACPVRMAADDHDRAVALTSHAPRLVASALTVLAERFGAFPAAGPAFERLVRAAGGDPSLWGSVFDSNADLVAASLRQVAQTLVRCASELEQGRLEEALALLAGAESARESFIAQRAQSKPLP